MGLFLLKKGSIISMVGSDKKELLVFPVKRAKPTHTDPEDDRQADPALPSGCMSKTWNPYKDHNFWSKKSSGEDPRQTLQACLPCNGDPSSVQEETYQALLAILPREALQCQD